jgi:hypothetical protein
MRTHDATVAADAGIKAAGQYDASVGLVVAERKVYECCILKFYGITFSLYRDFRFAGMSLTVQLGVYRENGIFR